MRNPVIIASLASIVVLSLAAVAFAATGDDAGPGGTPGGGGAAGACPAIDVPGISQEERERCFEADSPGGAPLLPPDRRPERAPIDGLDVAVAESAPPQYFLNVQAGLPSGCAQPFSHEVGRDGDVISVTVLNSMPAAADVVCTAIYGMYELNIALGSDFEPGETYTVRVNDETTTFTAQ